MSKSAFDSALTTIRPPLWGAFLLLCCAAGLALAQPGIPSAGAPILYQDAPAVLPERFIVVFRSSGRPSAARAAVAQSEAAEALVRRLGGTVRFRYRHALVGFSARMTPATLEAVRKMPGVEWVEAEQRYSAITGQPNPPDGLDRTSERIGLDQSYTYSATGMGVHAYILDTGIMSHPDFGTPSRLSTVGFTAYPNDGYGLADCDGHGTHVAGIVGGSIHGIAKDVILHSVRVLNCFGPTGAGDIVAGVDWVTAERLASGAPSVANMSLIGPVSTTIDFAVKNSDAAGVTYAVGAGNNNGADACNYSPQRVPEAITTGAIDPKTDKVASFSNLGPCVDIFAPGVGILSTYYSLPPTTKVMKGTSQAAPHVAGIAARILEINPAATPASVWAAIDYAASIPGQPYGFAGIKNLVPPWAAVNKLLHWGSGSSDGYMDGDPHLQTVDGVRYDFQGAGEFVYLREAGGIEVQVRQTPLPTASWPVWPDPYHGLSTCVSVNTAVAARVGRHRVTFQPGVPADPAGLQLRVDGALQSLTPAGRSVGAAVVKRGPANSMELRFPDGTVLVAVPGWLSGQNMWLLNVDIFGTSAKAGLLGTIAPGSWLPALPNGASLGAMPPTPAQRYAVLYRQFGDAWRVTGRTSLFDYGPGDSTANHTDRDWPRERGSCLRPQSPNPPATPIARSAAEQACAGVRDPAKRDQCVFDVAVTGERAFARAYVVGEEIRARFDRPRNRTPVRP